MAMMSSKPAALATPTAPTTPPAGPESRVRTGWLRVVATFIKPPFDWMMRSWLAQPISPSRVSSRFARRSILGMT